MHKALFLLTLTGAVLAGACSTTKENAVMKPLEVVPSVNIQKYLGTWYEIARYPNRFQEGCVATQVQYSLRDDGKVKVLNSCREDTVDGKEKSIEGKAWSVDKITNAKLKVQFFWPFRGDYWIIQLDKDYRYAVVGHPKRSYLWILSRTPTLDEATYSAIVQKLVEQGYDPARIIKTPQKTG
jgi:apolipoprotein D and lipocalin family protein